MCRKIWKDSEIFAEIAHPWYVLEAKHIRPNENTTDYPLAPFVWDNSF